MVLFQVANDNTKHMMARMAASAAWGRKEWTDMARYFFFFS